MDTHSGFGALSGQTVCPTWIGAMGIDLTEGTTAMTAVLDTLTEAKKVSLTLNTLVSGEFDLSELADPNRTMTVAQRNALENLSVKSDREAVNADTRNNVVQSRIAYVLAARGDLKDGLVEHVPAPWTANDDSDQARKSIAMAGKKIKGYESYGLNRPGGRSRTTVRNWVLMGEALVRRGIPADSQTFAVLSSGVGHIDSQVRDAISSPAEIDVKALESAVAAKRAEKSSKPAGTPRLQSEAKEDAPTTGTRVSGTGRKAALGALANAVEGLEKHAGNFSPDELALIRASVDSLVTLAKNSKISK